MPLNDRYFLNPAHLELARARYFLKDDNGQAVEKDIEETFQRVVNHIYKDDKEHADEALRLRREKKIIDAGRPLAQAGTKTENLLNCFVKNTMVSTTNGTKKIQDVIIGDKVVSHTGSVQNVSQIHKNLLGNRDIFSLKCSRTPMVSVTGNHKFLALSNDGKRTHGPYWMSVNDLCVGDYIAIPREKPGKLKTKHRIDISEFLDSLPKDTTTVVKQYTLESKTVFRNRGIGAKTCSKKHNIISRFWDVDEDFAFFIGVWLGDGCVFSHKSKNIGITFTTCIKENKLHQFICNFGSSMFGIDPVITDNEDQNTRVIAFNSQFIACVFESMFGRGFDGKRLPNYMFGWSNNLVSKLLSGVVTSDGTIAHNGTCKIEIRNSVLIEQLYHVSRQCGIPVSKSEGFVLYKGEKRETNKIGIPKGSEIIINALKNYDDERIAKSITEKTSKWKSVNGLLNKDDQYFVRLDKKTKIECNDEFVYTIGVENDHSYNVEGLVCENCFVVGFEDDTREAISELKRKHFNIQAQGGGTGINFSTLRPSGSVCKSTQSRSSGAVGFITDFSYQSSNISQGGNRCLPGDSLVAMADGSWKNIIDIRPNDVVLAFDKDTGSLVPSNVLRFYENGLQDLYEYKLAGGISVKSTSTHRWLGVQTDGRLFVRTIDDMPKSSKKIGYVNSVPVFGSLRSKWSGILGYLLGDGCFSGETIKLSVRNDYVRERFIRSIPTDMSYWENKDSVFVSTNGKLQEYLRNVSLYQCVADEKFIPDEVFLYNKKDIVKIVEGMIASDGWVTKEEIGYCSTSCRLVDDFRRLLLKFGISGYVQIDNRPRKGVVRKPLWCIRIKHPDSYNKFTDTFDVPGKSYRATTKEGCIQHKRRDDCVFHKVKSVEHIGRDMTFCIEIDHKDHLFVVDGAVSHNSGANMGILEDWHPDLYEFISKKSESNWENIRKFATIYNEDEFSYFQWMQPYKWQMFNVSVFVSDKLIDMVENTPDEPWVLNWEGTPWHLWRFKKAEGPMSKERHPKTFTVTAPNEEMAYFKASTQVPFFNNKDLELVKGPFDFTASEWFTMICEHAWADGCPGIMFRDLAKRYHNGEYFNPIEASNPCAEEIMPKNSVCCLTSIVLPSFFIDGEIMWDDLEKTVIQAVRGLDNIISVNETGEVDIDENSRNERRIGLGTTGIAELLILKGLKYSSEEGRVFVSEVLEFIRNKAYEASVELAKERGPFPAYEFRGFSQSEFFKTLPEYIQNLIRRNGIRNVTILTQAPTGTTGTMVGFSTGCEPYFAMCFLRNSRVGSFLDGSPAFMMWLHDKGIDYKYYDYNLVKLREEYEVPDYFEEAHEISWMDHLKMQAVFAKYVDSSVSKTINLPNSATVEDIKSAYLTAYKLGIKSTTVYRDGSKQQILEHIVRESDKKRPKEIVRAHAPQRPIELECDIYHTSVKGEKWTVLVGLLDDRPYEVFCASQENFEIAGKYKKGVLVKNGKGSYYLDTGDFKLKNISSYLNTDEHRVITRLLSTCLRHGVPMTFIADQLAKADGTVVDFSKAVMRVLKKYDDISSVHGKDLVCRSCGSSNVVLKGGCPECLDCGVSKCE